MFQHLSWLIHTQWTCLWTLNHLTGSRKRRRSTRCQPLSVRENQRVPWTSTSTTVKQPLVSCCCCTLNLILLCPCSPQLNLGLSQLSEEDLKQMRWEMNDKVQHLSKVLVEELQTRDQLIHSLNVKNTFISSLLKVQSLRYHPSEEKPSTVKVYIWLHSSISLNSTCYCPCCTWSTCTLWYHSIHRTKATGAIACYSSSPKVKLIVQ